MKRSSTFPLSLPQIHSSGQNPACTFINTHVKKECMQKYKDVSINTRMSSTIHFAREDNNASRNKDLGCRFSFDHLHKKTQSNCQTWNTQTYQRTTKKRKQETTLQWRPFRHHCFCLFFSPWTNRPMPFLVQAVPWVFHPVRWQLRLLLRRIRCWNSVPLLPWHLPNDHLLVPSQQRQQRHWMQWGYPVWPPRRRLLS